MSKFIIETLSFTALLLLFPLVLIYMFYVRVTSKMDYEPVHWQYLEPQPKEFQPSFYTLISDGPKGEKNG